MFHRALVTGGAGFIGSHLSRALLGEGLEVTVLDNLSTGIKANVPGGARFLHGDVRSESDVRRALEGVDIVFHEAARVSIRSSLDHFYDDAETNVMGTLSLLRGCAGSGVRRIVYASSMAVYADAPTPDPVSEDHPLQPISPYGVSKLACEHYMGNICPILGIEPVVLRYFNTYGPGQAYTPYVGVITIFVHRLLEGESPVVFGSGEQVRDFVSVRDIVRANLLAMVQQAGHNVYNIGSGRGRTVNEIAELLRRRIDPSVRVVKADEQPGEIRNSVADISRAAVQLGYEPRGSLEEDIDEVIAACSPR